MHIFLDSSVLLSFCRSKRGASALIIDYCIQRKVKLYISEKVVYEVQKNNEEDSNELGKSRFTAVLNQDLLTVIEDPTPEEIETADKAINNRKDAPIIAAAKKIAKIKYILSFDEGFFTQKVQAFVKSIEILKPGAFVSRFRKELDRI